MKTASRILYVDDHEDMRYLISTWLGAAGYAVVTADGAASGLRAAREQTFDLYLLDSRFTDGTGRDLCEKIREFDQTTPIVFYSGKTTEQLQEELSCRAQDFVMKPELDALPRVIDSAIRDASARPPVL